MESDGRHFNAGNCLMIGTMGVEQDWEGMEMWEKGAELVKKNGGEGAGDMWAEESNEKTACKDVLDLGRFAGEMRFWCVDLGVN